MLTSGSTAWRECIKALTRISESTLGPHTIRLVIAVVSPSAPSSVTIDEFSTVATRDLSLEARYIMQLDSAPTDAQVRLHGSADRHLLRVLGYCVRLCE